MSWVVQQFIDTWSQSFDDSKYPRAFYLACIDVIRSTRDARTLSEYFGYVLHWKDGKVRHDSEGTLRIASDLYRIKPSKQNTFDPERHMPIFQSDEFWEWSQMVMSLETFKPNRLKELQGARFNLWSENSLVIPAFVLHVLNPTTYPLFDQHVNRAMFVLSNRTAQVTQNRSLLVEDWIEYEAFWRHMVNDLYPDGNPSLQDLKKVDEALWSFGRWLKTIQSKQPTSENDRESQRRTIPMKAVRPSKTGFSPDNEFKRAVMALVRSGIKQGEAMLTVAQQREVQLKPSYFEYPGSHIDRWRKQGF